MQEQNLELSNAQTINSSPSLVSADNNQETEDPFGKSPQTFDKTCVREGVCVSNICCQWGSANIWEPFPAVPTPALRSAALDASTMDVKDKEKSGSRWHVGLARSRWGNVSGAHHWFLVRQMRSWQGGCVNVWIDSRLPPRAFKRCCGILIFCSIAQVRADSTQA